MKNKYNFNSAGKGSKVRPCYVRDNDFTCNWESIKWNSQKKQNKLYKSIRIKNNDL